jgi:hypothetical protein
VATVASGPGGGVILLSPLGLCFERRAQIMGERDPERICELALKNIRD